MRLQNEDFEPVYKLARPTLYFPRCASAAVAAAARRVFALLSSCHPIIDPTRQTAPPNPISSSVRPSVNLPSPHYKHTTPTIPCHPARFRERERQREGGRVQLSWSRSCVTPCLPLMDGQARRTGGAALFDSCNHHIASLSKSLLVLAAQIHRQHGWIFRCRGKGVGPCDIGPRLVVKWGDTFYLDGAHMLM